MADSTPLDAYRRRLDVAGTLAWVRLADVDGKGLARVAASIVASPTWPHSMRWAARTCGMDRLEFRFHWEALTGCGFHEFVERARVERALVLLATTDLRIEAIAHESGFDDRCDLRESLRSALGSDGGTVWSALRSPG